jgi:Holliday junction DNA helicase RuvA
LQVFELLLSVSGVGPKAALLLVSNLGKDRILDAIARSDTSVFKSVSGIGNKVAAKIIVELKTKVIAGDAGTVLLPEDDETIEALVTLGYKKSEVLPYLAKIPKNITSFQDKVKYVLKSVGKKP